MPTASSYLNRFLKDPISKQGSVVTEVSTSTYEGEHDLEGTQFSLKQHPLAVQTAISESHNHNVGAGEEKH